MAHIPEALRELFAGKRGYELVRDPLLNKGSAFTAAEREALDLLGILPPRVNSMAQQAARSYANVRRATSPIDQYVALTALQDRNEHLFYRLLLDHLKEFLPIVYTPTVGQATQDYSRVFQRSRGIWITPAMRGRIADVLRAATRRRTIRLLVTTDNESILGIGDQGAGGIAISIGKLSIYTAAAGIHPATTLPVSLDVGTDNPALLGDELYLGWREPRLRGAPFDALVEEFVEAVASVFPGALLQWEDLRKDTALGVLDRFRTRVPSFNDDIQGTGAIALAGLVTSGRITHRKLDDERILVYGAGAAGLGITRQILSGLKAAGVNAPRRHVCVLDSRGLLADDVPQREAYKRELAWPSALAQEFRLGDPHHRGLAEVIAAFRPTVLIGASGQPDSFDEATVRALAAHVERPVIFPLSNPTANAEAKPEDLIRWTGGRAVVAAGSPFAPVEYAGRTIQIGQGNNAFIFPGLGLGTLLSGASRVSDGMITAAARALTACITDAELAQGLLFPSVSRLRDAARVVAVAVMVQAEAEGLASALPDDPERIVRGAMWEPVYPEYA
jgi:malate dehydrogenase (oxaloacetate-decarboxylating)